MAAGLLCSAGCGAGEGGPAPLDPLPEAPVLAAVSADFRLDASSVALLRADGTAIVDVWIDSGTTPVGLDTTLSSDTVLPSAPCDDGHLTLIDRFDRDVVTRIGIPSGAILAQARLVARGPNLPAFTANPQDFVCPRGRSRAWVPRFEPSFEADPIPANAGSDLVPFDLATGTPRFDDRIDLAGPGSAPVQYPEPDPSVVAPPRPSRALATPDGGTILVALARLSADFTGAGAGAVAVVDLDAREVDVVLIPGLADCEDIRPVPEDPDAVVVSCLGWAASFDDFLDEAARRETAGLALLRRAPETGRWVVVAVSAARDTPDRPVAVVSPIPLGPGAGVLAIAWGDEESGRPDILWRVPLPTTEETFSAVEVLRAEEAFVLGRGVYDPGNRRVLLPDATRGIRRLLLDTEGALEREESPVEVGGALPVRSVARVTRRE